MDIAFLFWAIAAGIVLGAGLLPLAVFGSLFIGVILLIFANRRSGYTPYLLVVGCDGAAEQGVMETVRRGVKKYQLKSKTVSPDGVELTVEVRLPGDSSALVNEAAVLMAAAVLLVTVLSVCPEAVGVTAAENEAAYASLFDPFSVMEIDIAVDEDDWQEMLDNALSEEYISCDLTINGTTYSHVGVRPKGNTSLSTVASTDSDRFSFKFELDHYVDGQTCEGLDKFVVNNIQSDSTWMKEYLSYQILTELGVPTPLYCYAHITVNGEEWGLYLAVEALEDSFAERVYGLDHGQLYKVESMDMGGGMDFGDMDFSDFGDMDFGDFDPDSFDFRDCGFRVRCGVGIAGGFSDGACGGREGGPPPSPIKWPGPTGCTRTCTRCGNSSRPMAS